MEVEVYAELAWLLCSAILKWS